MEIFFEDRQKDLKVDPESVVDVSQAVVAFEGMQYDDLSISFVEEEEICQLHQQYFNDPSPTDCISFSMDDEESSNRRVLGDVVVCPKTANHYVTESGGDVYEETTLYLIHGILHLLGYNDIEENDRKKMRSAERKHLENLKKQKILLKK